MLTKTFAFSDTKKRTISKNHNVKTSAARQVWKVHCASASFPLSQDIIKVFESEILETRNEMTLIGGEIVYPR